VAVDRLSFTVRPGTVTGFLGPNGSGSSTTLRMIMGLDFPDSGQDRIGGRACLELRWPLREVGALLEARAFHPGRTARSHLAALAASNRIPGPRVDEVLATVGLAQVAGRAALSRDLTPGHEEQAGPERQRRERDLHDVLGGEH
jgi:ABC-2 type transport system ATP-binding protein